MTRNLFGSTPVRPPLDAVVRLKALQAAGLSEDDARRVVGREIDGAPAATPVKRARPPKPANVVLAPATRTARETPVSPDITNRFRPAADVAPSKERFDPVAHYSLADPVTIGQTTKRGENVPVLIGYTSWPETDDRSRFNGTLHIAGLGQATLNLSFDALAGLIAAAAKIEAYLAQHGPAVATAEASGAAARKGKKSS